jgi:DNA-binding protein H-NS
MARTSVATQLAKIRKDREALEKKEKDLLARSNTRELSKIVAMAKAAGLTGADIAKAMASGTDKVKSTGASKGRKAKAAGKSSLAGRKVAPKYRNPADANQTWTGRGVAPKWVADLRSAGQLESAAIAAAPAV